jgi:hypothetical protein
MDKGTTDTVGGLVAELVSPKAGELQLMWSQTGATLGLQAEQY